MMQIRTSAPFEVSSGPVPRVMAIRIFPSLEVPNGFTRIDSVAIPRVDH